MRLDAVKLRALEDAVGADNVRTDAATLASYCWNGGVGSLPGPKFQHWPAAVVQPGNTEEVARVVRACLAHDLKFRPLSTGNGAFYVSRQPGVVVIDLFRMDRIVKIDKANQMAVIEPYVTAGRLQAEAMQHGLTTHIVGAGPGHSPLGSATSFMGIGITGASTGANFRNILALEWVTPKGEIVRIGSTGEDDWFSEEGPGLGFRGIVRGFMGAQGGLGIFTRIGYKLYPWAGPGKLSVTGRFPQAGLLLAPNMRFFAPAWNNAEQMAVGVKRLNKTGLIFALLRMPPLQIGFELHARNNEYAEHLRNGTLSPLARPETRFAPHILTVGHSEAEVAHQDRVVRKIVAETGGRLLDLDSCDIEVLTRGLVTSQYVMRVARTGGLSTSFGVVDSWNLWPKAIGCADRLVEELRKSGNAGEDVQDGHWAWPTESRQLWTEHIISASTGRAGEAAGIGSVLRHYHYVHRDHIGMAAFVAEPVVDLFANKNGANRWMRRIKAMIDPGWRADSSGYISPHMGTPARLWRLVEPLFASAPGQRVLNSLLRTFLGKMAKAKSVKLSVDRS